MKAIIMAGGEGSRLRPLTCSCPKPMVPLMDRPVMSYAVELLKKHGVREAAATLHYLPDQIKDYFADGSAFGISMRYYEEKEPLGTAGSVRQAKEFLIETFAVLSGDGVTDCDLTAALAFHREKDALVTLVLKAVESPLEYGVVVADSRGRIKRFMEKPGWGEVFSNTVNTGIYIMEPEVLDLIPEGRPFDFGRELFPALLEAGMPVYGFVTDAYWCDIGDISAYLRAHTDAMEGRINLPMNVRKGGVYRMPGARVERGAVLEGPCFIGEGAVVKEGARIGAYSVLGAGSVVEAHASVKRAILWEQAKIGRNAQARGCVLADGALLGEESCAFEESALGCRAQLGARGTLLPGVKIWPGKQTEDGARLDANLVWGGSVRAGFHAGRLPLMNPSQAARYARAYASAMKPKNVLMGRSASSVALSYALAAEAGLMAQGVQVLDAGVSTLPQLRVMQELLKADGALFINEEDMRPLTWNGTEPSRQQQRTIENLLMRQDFERAFSAVTKLPVPAGRSDMMYVGYLLNHADTEAISALCPKVAVCAANEQLLSAAECVLDKAGCAVRGEWEEEMMELAPGEIGLWLTEGGEGIHLAGEDGSLTESECVLLKVWAMLESGAEQIILPVGATRAAETLATQYGAQILRVKGERASFMRALSEEDRQQLMMHFDGLYAFVQCLSMLARRGLTLEKWLRSMPRMSRRTRSVEVARKDRGRILSALLAEEQDADMTDGLCVAKDGAWAWVSPDEEKAECRVVTEALNAETAKELCDFYADRILKAIGAKTEQK